MYHRAGPERRRERQYGLPARQEVLLRSRRALGGFLSEGSPQGRMGQGPRTVILLVNPPVTVEVLVTALNCD